MRKNYERVFNLKNDLIRDINEWFDAKDGVIQIDFKKMFSVQIEVASLEGDYDWGVEYVVIKSLTNDNYVVDNEGGEIELQELNSYKKILLQNPSTIQLDPITKKPLQIPHIFCSHQFRLYPVACLLNFSNYFPKKFLK